jgi:hypothetical protein
MALHNFANDFFTLLASDRTDEDLESMLTEEWYGRWGAKKEDTVGLILDIPDQLIILDIGSGSSEFSGGSAPACGRWETSSRSASS